MRIRRADGTLIPPEKFIAAAEQGGLSRALTREVLELALDQLARWRADGYDLRVSVNTTLADLLDVDFPREVVAALAVRHLPHRVLVLEVTETAILSDPVRIGSVLARFREFGIALSLDDFGTGYSTLTHLKSLPVGEVKIDRSFIARMCRDATDEAIVQGTIQLAHTLGIRVVAEGLEDEETWKRLNAMECDLVQGYVLSRPLMGPALEALLRTDGVRTGGARAEGALGAVVSAEVARSGALGADGGLQGREYLAGEPAIVRAPIA